MNVIKTKWYGWIPTNRGKLNFDFIELPDFLISKNTTTSYTQDNIIYENLDISYLSDSYGYKKYIQSSRKSKVEYPATANASFVKESTRIQGDIHIIYEDFCSLSTKFICEQNGIVEFEDISFEDIDSIENELLPEIKSLLYVLIKTLIHGDAHHHQKIDVALPIIDSEFKPSTISSSLLEYIKLAERNIKITRKCESLLRNENLLFEIDGYLSYFKSFTFIFEEDKAVKKDYEFAQSVLASLKSTVAKRKNKTEFMSGIVTAFITFFGLIISVNILLNNFWLQEQNNITSYLSNQNRYYYFVSSVAFFMIIFFWYTKCKIISYFYYNYYHFFEFSRLIQNANFRDLNWKGRCIQFIPLYFMMGSFLIWFFST